MGRKIIRDYIFKEVKEGCVAWSETLQNVSHSFRYELDINNNKRNNALGSENDIGKDPGVGTKCQELTACKTVGQRGQESSPEQDEVGELDVNDSIQALEMDFIWTLARDSQSNWRLTTQEWHGSNGKKKNGARTSISDWPGKWHFSLALKRYNELRCQPTREQNSSKEKWWSLGIFRKWSHDQC